MVKHEPAAGSSNRHAGVRHPPVRAVHPSLKRVRDCGEAEGDLDDSRQRLAERGDGHPGHRDEDVGRASEESKAGGVREDDDDHQGPDRKPGPQSGRHEGCNQTAPASGRQDPPDLLCGSLQGGLRKHDCAQHE